MQASALLNLFLFVLNTESVAVSQILNWIDNNVIPAKAGIQ